MSTLTCSHEIKSSRGLTALLSLLLLLLTGCAPILRADTTLEVQAEEHWVVSVELVFAASDALLFGDAIQGYLNDVVAEMRGGGIEAGWEPGESPDGNAHFLLTLTGDSFEKLNQGVFEGSPVLRLDTSERRNRVVFQMNPRGIFNDAQQQTFTLRGGRILASNGTAVDRNTVVWVNPTTTMEAVMAEPQPFTWAGWALVVGGLGLIGFSSFKLTRKRGPLRHRPTTGRVATLPPEPRPEQPARPTPTPVYCTTCGHSLPAAAKFCTNCGTPHNS